MEHFYYYNPETRLFTMRCSKPYPFTDQPYIKMPVGWRYDLYRMSVNEEPELIS